MTRLSQKQAGAYYTPDAVVANLVRWAVRKDNDRMLDPSCGDGRFIATHRNSFGVEQDAGAAAAAMGRTPRACVHQGDFFAWAARTRERFECAAGNPPFIRYQTFNGEVRKRALALCAGLGARFSGLTASPACPGVCRTWSGTVRRRPANAVHGVHLRDGKAVRRIVGDWDTPFPVELRARRPSARRRPAEARTTGSRQDRPPSARDGIGAVGTGGGGGRFDDAYMETLRWRITVGGRRALPASADG